MAHVPVVDVVNIARGIDDAKQSYDAIDFTLPTAIVLGAEGSGISRLVREHCDLLVSLPMRGRVESLNASAAIAAALFAYVLPTRKA